MAREIGGMRVGRSLLTPTGAANEVEVELDFQLGVNGGVEILGLMGLGVFHDDSPAVSDTAPNTVVAHQTLHLETGATEDLPDVAAEDAVNLDTEIVYAQMFQQTLIVGTTNTFGAGGYGTVMPNGMWIPPRPIISARNLTHKATTVSADTDLEATLFIYYVFLELTDTDIVKSLARR